MNWAALKVLSGQRHNTIEVDFYVEVLEETQRYLKISATVLTESLHAVPE